MGRGQLALVVVAALGAVCGLCGVHYAAGGPRPGLGVPPLMLPLVQGAGVRLGLVNYCHFASTTTPRRGAPTPGRLWAGRRGGQRGRAV